MMLQQEWNNARHSLPSKLRDVLRKPVFALVPGLGAWGRWHAAPKRLLELKLELVLEHPWYAVLEVMLHEMAHQVVEECFPYVSESAHGPVFQKICRLLGTNPAASGDSPTLDQKMHTAECSVSHSEQILQKIRKLLALSESGNIHEAEAALLKAKQLSAKHTLELAQINHEADFHMMYIGEIKKRVELADHILANILQNHFKVLVIWDNQPDFVNGEWHRILKVHGRLSDLKIAGYVYDCLNQQIDAAWEELCRKQNIKKPGKRMKRDFSIGVLDGFAKLLARQETPALSEHEDALVIIQEAKLREYYQYHNPRIRMKRSHGVQINRELYHKGERTGRNIVISPGLEKQDSQGIKWLKA